VKGEGAVLGVNLWEPIVTNEDLLRSCTKVCELMELSLEVVSGVGRGMGVLEGSMCPKGKGRFQDFSISLVSVAYFLTEMYSTHHVHKSHQWTFFDDL